MAQHDRILGYFLEEATDHLNTIEQGLRKLPETVRDPGTIRELFRAAHSIKGSAAMLGLVDVQQVGNQFEANFKLLKEQPNIPIDPKLQNLFLESFNFLRAAITEIRTSDDPYRRDPATPDPIGDPVFEELKSYLHDLLSGLTVTPFTAKLSENNFTQDPAIEQVFGEYVTRKLGEIKDLCGRSDEPQVRAEIQQICQKLGGLGDNFEFLEWTNLFTACRLAIANPHNSLQDISKSIGTAIEQAQILILTDRHQSIGITPDLEALIDSPEARLKRDKNGTVAIDVHHLDNLPIDLNATDTLPHNGSDPTAHILLQSPILDPDLSSIHDRVQSTNSTDKASLFDEDSDNLANFNAVPSAEIDRGSMELDEFMNLLGDDIPPGSTWMQDDEFSRNEDDFSLVNFAENIDNFPTHARDGNFYEQIFEPSPSKDLTLNNHPTQQNNPLERDENSLLESQKSPAISREKEPNLGTVQYEEETYFNPDFGDIDDPDIATFWSDTPLDAQQEQIFNGAERDLSTHGNAARFQPEQPVDRDLDATLPDFRVDDRSMSDLFPSLGENEAWEQENSDRILDDTNKFDEINLDQNNDFDADLPSSFTQSVLNPFGSIEAAPSWIGTIDTQEQTFTTQEQIFTTNESIEHNFEDNDSSEIHFEMNVLASPNAAADFGDLELSDPIEFQESEELNSRFDYQESELSGLIREMNIDETADWSETFAIDLPEESDLLPTSDLLAQVDQNVALKHRESFGYEESLDNSSMDRDSFAQLANIDIDSDPTVERENNQNDVPESVYDSSNMGSLEPLVGVIHESSLPMVSNLNPTTPNQNLAQNLDIPHTNDLTGSFSGALLFEDFDSNELGANSGENSNSGLLTGWLDSSIDPHTIDDFAGLDLNGINDPDRNNLSSKIGNNFSDLDSNYLNISESVNVLNGSHDFGSVDELETIYSNSEQGAEPIVELSIPNNFGDGDSDEFMNLELIVDPSVNHDFGNVDELESIYSNSEQGTESIVDLSIPNNFGDGDSDEFMNLEPIVDPSVNHDFGNVDELESIYSNSEQGTESIVDLSIPNNFGDRDSDEFMNLEPIVDPSVNHDFGSVDELASISSDSEQGAEPIVELSIPNNFGDGDSDEFMNLEPIVDPSVNHDFGNVDELASIYSNSEQGAESIVKLSIPNNFGGGDLDYLGTLEPMVNFGDGALDLDSFNDADLIPGLSDNGVVNIDLNSFDRIDMAPDVSTNNNFIDLDLNSFNSSELSINGDFANIDLNLDLADESIFEGIDSTNDLGNLLDLNPNSDIDDLGSFLLGTAAIGGGAALIAGGGSTFDDLDALMGTAAPTGDSSVDFNDLDGLLSTPTPIASPPTVEPAAPVTKSKKGADRRVKQRTFEQTMRVSVRHLDNLNNLVGELVVNRNTLEQDQNRMRQFIEKLLSEVQKLNEVGKRMQDLYERSLMENSLIASRQQSKAQIAPVSQPLTSTNIEDLDRSASLMEYDPLEMDRFTPIHLLSQKMIELTVRVRESTADIEFVVDGSTEVTRTLRQITGQLQEDLTKSRMIPFSQTADRLQRGVRDNGLKYGKEVELSIEGRDTLIDKVILENLSDPLIHMVNNAIAHGIETPATRQAAGKPPEGKITVRALHQGNQTIISIADDGGGIDTERVKAKAIEKGIITLHKSQTMTKAEVYDLLFLPSFSTKDQADELAGRGVGMDVVRTSLNDIRGTISTESLLGIGTTFTIRLPLALSIAKALITVNNKTNIAFPMDGIEDTQDVSPEQIQTNSDGEPCIFWRDNLMPFKPLSDLLGFNRPLPRNNFYGAQEDDTDLVSILILRSDGNLMAVQVDRIIGDREIAIKPLQGPASKPLGIAGATVMGDGRIIPIADVIELIDLAKGKLVRHVSAQWNDRMSAPTPEHRESTVLIVDDSITVRELLSLTFKRAGYRVEQARDGQEAWDKLRAGLPCDIVFCDIEMPRMDGLEFLSRIQKDASLKKVPVAMLTSRGSDRHRQIASQLGASGYFIKPYLEEALLDAAKRMIGGEVLAIV